MQEKFSWSETTFKDINWEGTRVALNRLKTHPTTLIKHLNDIIPVAKRAHHYDPKHPASCPSCQEPIETSEHLHLCNSPAKITWRNHFLYKHHEKLSEKHPPLETMELMLWKVMKVIPFMSLPTQQKPKKPLGGKNC